MSDLGLGLSADEITVLCRRAPASNGKIDWATFAPRQLVGGHLRETWGNGIQKEAQKENMSQSFNMWAFENERHL
jgi:hypothetical protein